MRLICKIDSTLAQQNRLVGNASEQRGLAASPGPVPPLASLDSSSLQAYNLPGLTWKHFVSDGIRLRILLTVRSRGDQSTWDLISRVTT